MGSKGSERKLRHHFRTKCPLREWIVLYKELQRAKEENASDVHHGRQQPRKECKESAELSQKISEAQQEFAVLLDNQVDEEDFDDQLAAFLIHIGYLMGYSNRTVPAEDDPAAGEDVLAEEEFELMDPEEEERLAVVAMQENNEH